MENKQQLLDDIAKAAKQLRSRTQPDGYAPQIISLSLRALEKVYGREEANRVIRDFGLKRLGWKEEPIEPGAPRPMTASTEAEALKLAASYLGLKALLNSLVEDK